MSSFPHSTCPVCGTSAVSECPRCGLKSIGFFAAVHAGLGLLAVAYTALMAATTGDVDPQAHMRFLSHAGKIREWLTHQIGALAQWGRDNRPPAHGQVPRPTKYEEEVHAYARKEPILTMPLQDVTPELLDAAVQRFLELAAPATAKKWTPAAMPVLVPVPVAAPVEVTISSAERELLGQLEVLGLKTPADVRAALDASITPGQRELLEALKRSGVENFGDLVRGGLSSLSPKTPPAASDASATPTPAAGEAGGPAPGAPSAQGS